MGLRGRKEKMGLRGKKVEIDGLKRRRERLLSRMQVSDQLVHAEKTGDGSWTKVVYQGTVLRSAGAR